MRFIKTFIYLFFNRGIVSTKPSSSLWNAHHYTRSLKPLLFIQIFVAFSQHSCHIWQGQCYEVLCMFFITILLHVLDYVLRVFIYLGCFLNDFPNQFLSSLRVVCFNVCVYRMRKCSPFQLPLKDTDTDKPQALISKLATGVGHRWTTGEGSMRQSRGIRETMEKPWKEKRRTSQKCKAIPAEWVSRGAWCASACVCLAQILQPGLVLCH